VSIRVLVVDDSLVVRRIIVQALDGFDDITVVGQAADGQAALEQIEALSPDLVTLDIEMPVMDGIEAMRHIKARWPRLPVVMFSTLTERGAAMTLEALMAGARDYVTKPTNSTGLADSLQQVRTELGTRVRALVPPRRAASPAAPATPARPLPSPAVSTRSAVPSAVPSAVRTQPSRLSAVVIGASTGGPDALSRVLGALPADLPVPVLVVQHMPAVFTQTFAERLDRTCALHVVEARDGDRIEPGTVYLAPGDFHMEVTTGLHPSVHLQQGEPENFCRPAVDVLFRSAAAAYGRAVLGVVLTGMGSDGARGSQSLVDAGAEVYVQDEATSVVWGMPRAVADAGLASQTLPCDRVAPAILARLNRPISEQGTR
jgi:two-component system chemotaxis response regulator CheB